MQIPLVEQKKGYKTELSRISPQACIVQSQAQVNLMAQQQKRTFPY
jgi:hypothetical protein